MRQNLVRNWLVAGLLVGLQGGSVLAQNGETGAPSPSEAAAPPVASGVSVKAVSGKAGQSESSDPAAKGGTQYPAGVGEVLKMLQAGVSKDVMKAYVETAPVAIHLSATDIVTLKERGVPDDVTLALIKRGAELAAQANRAGSSSAAPAKVTGSLSLNELAAVVRSSQPNSGGLDPEGYDYFRYYYLYPRTIASANERIYSSYPWFSGYGGYMPGYATPWAFRPRFFAPY